MDDRLPKDIAVARLRLAKNMPYLSSALWSLIPVESKDIRTMGVDKYWRLYFNPEWYKTITSEEVSSILYHEILHLLREHHERATQMMAIDMLYNIAGDLEINDDIRAEGMSMPDGCLFPEQFKIKGTDKPMPEGWLAEQYYENLPVQEIQCTCPQNGKSGSQQSQDGSTGNEEGSSNGSSGTSNGQGEEDKCNHSHSGQSGGDSQSGGSDPRDPSSGQSKKTTSGKGQDCPLHGKNPIPGSSASGTNPAPWEKGTSEGRKIGKAESEIVRRKVAQEVSDHVQKSRGTVPGHLERWAKEKLSPQVPWRQVLKGAVRRVVADVSGAVDYVRTRPSRRQSAFGDVVIPALRKPLPSVAIQIDTSGSMSDKELSMGKAEVEGVLKSVGVREVTVFTVDAYANKPQRVASSGRIRMEGGGGTDMGVGIRFADEEMRPRPDILIVFTDGYTPWPAKAPKNMRVIVVSTTQEKGPDWAKTVHVDQKK